MNNADAVWAALDAEKSVDEESCVRALLDDPPLDASARAAVVATARALVSRARGLKRRQGVMESFLEEFGLTTAEGLALMCLAEALLRVPDAETADKLIAEKLRSGRWSEHLGHSDSWLVNAGVWGLMLSGYMASLPEDAKSDAGAFFARLGARVGEPVVRAAAMEAMRILGEQFVLGRSIEAALRRGSGIIKSGRASSFSFDMLGEGARTDADAERYFDAYAAAVRAVGAVAGGEGPHLASGVSVKLSALDPRYEARQEERVWRVLYPRVLELARLAKSFDIGLTLDAEEADRLTLSLKIFRRLALEPDLAGWEGLGVAIQAYQKRARSVTAHVADIAAGRKGRIQARLVKGAYWDGEIKRAQVAGRADYPVFTTKAATDVSYLACARVLLGCPRIYSQFATHNAHTIAAIARLAAMQGGASYEHQRLHGMGEALYAAIEPPVALRVYAPVGGHEELLPYLVRRLLENGANTSFVHAFLDEDTPVEAVVADPIAALEARPSRHPRLPPPPKLYGPSRPNPSGRDLSVQSDRDALIAAAVDPEPLRMAAPRLPEEAIEGALAAFAAWDGRGGVERARVLRAMGDALQRNADPLVALIAEEAGRTLFDAIEEVREAIDFCRYYACEAERLFSAAVRLPGPAGETNDLSLSGRGVFVCISPWNFPLAIFTGQAAAALAAGNSVIAKPAEQTPRVAAAAVGLFRDAGLPEAVLQLCLGGGDIGAALVSDPRIAGVAFTGSTETAWAINRALAAKSGPIPVFVAETGGLNGMFVDTTALKEQVVDDVIVSAFHSAGQRCSSLRVLFLPHESADEIEAALMGAMDALKVGDPADPATDIGPIIDAEAKAGLVEHMERMRREARVLKHLDANHGLFFGPALVALDSLDQLDREVFGPILHVLRYDPDDVAALGAQLASKGYGLTLGVHSRLQSFADAVRASAPAGNVYVNRSMIGAVVGVQPFGGLGLSGTGPKAGGPHYLPRFAQERTVTINIAAQGGDPALLNL